MNRKSLPPKSGKLLVFGGVYSNLQALQALKKFADEEQIEPGNIICHGDVIGYCAQPEEVVSFVKEWGIDCIAGNVELQLAEGKDDCGCDFNAGSRCDIFSKQWYPYAQSKLSPQSIDWAKKLPEIITFEYEGFKVGLVHGSAFETAEYIFKSTEWSTKQRNFDKLDADIIIAGHSGLPFYDTQNDKHWVNPGVIGMPANDGNQKVWCATLEIIDNKLVVNHHQLAYDYKLANKLMVEEKLPDAYAKTLLTGLWDNCEILPEAETKQQGKAILF